MSFRMCAFAVLPLLAVAGACRTVADDGGRVRAPAASHREAKHEHVDAFATVGDVVLPRNALDDLMALKIADRARSDRPVSQEWIDKVTASTARRLVREEQLRQACREAGVRIEPTQLATREAKVLRWYPDRAKFLRNRGETLQSFHAILTAELCEEALVFATIPPATEEEIARKYRNVIAEEKAIEGWVSIAVAATPPLPEADGEVPPSSAAQRAAWARDAEEFRAAASAPGADFIALATTRGLASEVYELVRRESRSSELRAALAQLRVGEVSPPFLVEGSWHVVKLLEVEGPGPLPMARVRDTLERMVRRSKYDDAREIVFADLDRRHPIRFHIELPQK